MTFDAPAADTALPGTALLSLRRELAEALEQQTATSEILRVISRSPTDAQPVFESIAHAALALCAARSANVFTFDGTLLHLAAAAIADPAGLAAMRSIFPRPPSRDSAACRAVLSGQTVAIPDVMADPDFVTRDAAVAAGFRSSLAVPLLREGRPLGAIAVGRAEPGPFPPRQIELLQTFAAQALIAIDNVRLFNELEARNRELADALEQQTATSEILRVISRSPTDVQPVFDTIAAAARKLCKSRSANVFTFDGHLIHAAALTVTDPQGLAAVRKSFPRPPGRELAAPRAILTRAVVEIRDVREDPDFLEQQVAATANFRSVLAVPLMRHGDPLGAIAIGRPEPGPFPPQQIALLQTFADQAVIAIENTRLFTETREALEHQTATSDVLRMIGSSMADATPVFEKILDCCERLFGATDLGVFLVEGADRLNAAAWRGSFADVVSGRYPRPLAGTMSEAVIRHGAPRQWADVAAATDVPAYIADSARKHGSFSVAVAPLMWDGRGIGTLDVMRKPPRKFSDKELALLRSFADQAVIAIENARLFNQTREALERQTATADILKVISESPTDVQPVLAAVAERSARLSDAKHASVMLREGDWLRPRAGYTGEPGEDPSAGDPLPLSRGYVNSRALLERRTVHIEDVVPLLDTEYPQARENQRHFGFRTMLAVPMMREGEAIGTIFTWRREVHPFSKEEIELVQTFADQAVIAIENTRLFTELQDKTRQLEVANRHKTAFLANMSHELRTPLNAVLGFTRIVQRETRAQIAPKQAENLDKILASARHLVGLINATLDLTRIEAGRIEITPSEIALAPLLDECLRSIEPLAADGVLLSAQVPPALPPLRVDVEKLHQILLNLLGNAVKFTERGQIELRAACRDARVVIEVADTGIGIPPGKLEAVFEEFEQVDASHTRAQGGTGLGLAIARRLARAMGGDLQAVSALGVGSTFTLTLPLRWKERGET